MRETATHRVEARWGALLLALCLVAPAALAKVIIPSGGRVVLFNGFSNLACTDLAISGVLDIGSGLFANVHDLTVEPSGAIQGTGTIRYSGKLSVSGAIDPSVNLVAVPPTSELCPDSVTAEVTAIPTLGNSMLVALAMLLLLPALLVLRGRAAPRRCSEANGTNP